MESSQHTPKAVPAVQTGNSDQTLSPSHVEVGGNLEFQHDLQSVTQWDLNIVIPLRHSPKPLDWRRLAQGDPVKSAVNSYLQGDPVNCQQFNQIVSFIYRKEGVLIKIPRSELERIIASNSFDSVLHQVMLNLQASGIYPL